MNIKSVMQRPLNITNFPVMPALGAYSEDLIWYSGNSEKQIGRFV